MFRAARIDSWNRLRWTTTKVSRRVMSDGKPTAKGALKESEPAAGPVISASDQLGSNHKVGMMDRYFLVLTKHYSSVAQVPAYVSQSTMERSRNIMRIKINLSLIVGLLVMALFAVRSGKQSAAEGESLQKQNLLWHRKYNEEKKSKEE